MKTIAFQGEFGAYSHEACMHVCRCVPLVRYKSFEDVITTVKHAKDDLAMLSVENTTYGRVAHTWSALRIRPTYYR